MTAFYEFEMEEKRIGRVLLNFILTKLGIYFFLSLYRSKARYKMYLIDARGSKRQNKTGALLTLPEKTIKIVVKSAVYFMLSPRVRVSFRP